MLANERFVAERAAARSSRPSGRSSSATGASSSTRRLTRRLARRRSRRGRRSSGSAGCERCSPTSATRSATSASIHVVGTNGKTSTTLMTAALLRAEGLRVGAYISPHVRGWSERIQVDGADADLDACARARPAACRRRDAVRGARRPPRSPSSRRAGVDVAVVEAGLGGRHDATNVLDARVVVLTNVSLEHTDVLGDTREAIAAEKLAVVSPGATVVLGEPEWEPAARAAGAGRVEVMRGLEPRARACGSRGVPRPARRSRRGRGACAFPAGSSAARSSPLEIWDGAHNLAGIGYLLPRLPDAPLHGRRLDPRRQGRRRDAAGAHGRSATRSSRRARRTRARSRPRSWPARRAVLRARRGGRPTRPRRSPRARELAGPDGAVLVTGSLYLLAALSLDG